MSVKQLLKDLFPNIQHEPERSTSRLGALGLISGMIDHLGIVTAVDEILTQKTSQKQISLGNIVKVFVLNGLNTRARPLWRINRNFTNLELSRLFPKEANVVVESLNDDRLGRALDELYEFGVSSLFGLLVGRVNRVLGIDSQWGHLDTTSFHLDGEYSKEATVLEGEEVTAIAPNHGYSRDHRPDLKQVNLALMVDTLHGIPFFMKPLSGNESDQAAFLNILQGFKENLTNPVGIQGIVADAAMATQDTLRILVREQVPFVTRAPATSSQVKVAIQKAQQQFMEYMQNSGLTEPPAIFTHEDRFELEMGEQESKSVLRLVCIRSEENALQKEKSGNQILLKLKSEDEKHIRRLKKQMFHCDEDAEAAIRKLESELKVMSSKGLDLEFTPRWDQRGRPNRDYEADRYEIRVCGEVSEDEEKVSRLRQYEGWFCILSNVAKDQQSAEDLLSIYKRQSKVERGFRFLKSPYFLLPAFFLKKPSRMESLMFLMTVTLLVYSALEREVKRVLAEHDEEFFPELGRPKKKTRRPSMEYLLDEFSNIFVSGTKLQADEISGLKLHHQMLLVLLGMDFIRPYVLKTIPGP